MINLDKDKLISAIYSASMSPDNFDDTLNNIDDLVFEPGTKNCGIPNSYPAANKPVIDPDLISHIQRARDIQLRVGRGKNEKDNALMILDAAPNPAYIFDRSETIIAMNDHAKNLGKGDIVKLRECCENTAILEDIRKFIGNGADPNLMIAPGFINPQQDSNSCVLVRKMNRSSLNGLQGGARDSGKLYFFTIVNLGFDRSKTELFQEAYGLTPAEVDIAVQLASGDQLPEIAIRRNAAIITVRTQVKSIKKKTGARDIPAIVRLLCGFSAGILTSSQFSSDIEQEPDGSSTLKSTRQITLRDGRRMIYMEQGNPTGDPVIMIHNMPYGVELPQKAIEAADRMNLRILAPYRPGTGESDDIKEVNEDKYLNEVATDLNELLDRLKIRKAVIVGQTIGSVYAMRFANLYPDRVSHLFAVSRAPMWRDEWLAGMPKRQRFSMRLTKYVPQLLPLVMQATTMFIDNGHGPKLVHSLCSESTADAQVLTRSPEIVDLMVCGCEEGLKQGVEAFCRDCHLSIKDFSEEAQTLKHSFHILHGDADEIVNIRQSREFARIVPGTELEVVKGAGQLLFYSHWDRVLKAIRNKLKR